MRVVNRGILFAMAMTLGASAFGFLPALADPVDEERSEVPLKSTDRESAAVQRKKEVETSGSLEHRVPCDQVIATFDRATAQSGRPVEVGGVAEKLNTSPFWVERCMDVYGRHPQRVLVENSEEMEQRLESLEGDEPEEIAPEDVEEEGVRTRPERPEGQKSMHGNVRLPTPGESGGYNQGYGD